MGVLEFLKRILTFLMLCCLLFLDVFFTGGCWCIWFSLAFLGAFECFFKVRGFSSALRYRELIATPPSTSFGRALGCGGSFCSGAL